MNVDCQSELEWSSSYRWTNHSSCFVVPFSVHSLWHDIHSGWVFGVRLLVLLLLLLYVAVKETVVYIIKYKPIQLKYKSGNDLDFISHGHLQCTRHVRKCSLSLWLVLVWMFNWIWVGWLIIFPLFWMGDWTTDFCLCLTQFGCDDWVGMGIFLRGLVFYDMIQFDA